MAKLYYVPTTGSNDWSNTANWNTQSDGGGTSGTLPGAGDEGDLNGIAVTLDIDLDNNGTNPPPPDQISDGVGGASLAGSARALDWQNNNGPTNVSVSLTLDTASTTSSGTFALSQNLTSCTVNSGEFHNPSLTSCTINGGSFYDALLSGGTVYNGTFSAGLSLTSGVAISAGDFTAATVNSAGGNAFSGGTFGSLQLGSGDTLGTITVSRISLDGGTTWLRTESSYTDPGVANVAAGVTYTYAGTSQTGTRITNFYNVVEVVRGVWRATIVRGDDYLAAAGSPLVFTDQGQWGDLSGCSAFALQVRSEPDAEEPLLSLTGGTYTPASGETPAQVAFDAGHADTAEMPASVQPLDQCFDVEARWGSEEGGDLIIRTLTPGGRWTTIADVTRPEPST